MLTSLRPRFSIAQNCSEFEDYCGNLHGYIEYLNLVCLFVDEYLNVI